MAFSPDLRFSNRWKDRPHTAAVSYGFFETLHVHPEAGRTFEARNEQPGNQTAAILSGVMARRAFGTVNDALGKTIKLDDQSYSVIGVLPDAFRLDVLRTPDVFVPLTVSAALARDERNLVVIGRLRPNGKPGSGASGFGGRRAANCRGTPGYKFEFQRFG